MINSIKMVYSMIRSKIIEYFLKPVRPSGIEL